MTTDPEALQTIAYLANELRKAHETAAGLYQAVQQQKAELDKLKVADKIDDAAEVADLRECHASNLKEISRLKALVAGYVEEIGLDDKRIAALEAVLRAIPACPGHGDLCIPGALQWIEAAKVWIPPAYRPNHAAHAAPTEGDAP